MTIRHSTYDDIPEMFRIFDIARKFMHENGNPTQWPDGVYPYLEIIEKDIRDNNSYVIINNNKIVGTFALIFGVDSTYIDIDGKWLNDKPYGTIHRIASDQSVKDIFKCALDFAISSGKDIRVDTHKDNKPMIHLLTKNGFKYCGLIKVADGTLRNAYQLVNN